MAVVSGCSYWTARRLARPRVVIVIADDADGAASIFWPRTDPDHSGSGSAFTTEGDVDAQYPKECLRTTQSAGEFPGTLVGQAAVPLGRLGSARAAPARRRSEALPVHVLRFAMICRTQAATGSASIKSSIAALRFA